ncbi:MAG TPA: ABC transporter ATP-binding protein [Nitrososphaerales archaeon]|nr:ABC transporter ATP-binding protein [Nitrososphaerales archaeon]
MTSIVIETENLTKIFGSKLIAVNNLSLKVEEGEILGFLGQNGAGKTTTIRLLLGLIKPTAGDVSVFGERMNSNSSNLRKRIGYLPTNPRFPPKMTPIQYLDFVGKLFYQSKDERMGKLSKLIRAVGLLPSASREIKGFSTGMITRLGLAAALMNDPDLLILDEPTSGLDPAGRKSTLELIQELGKEKTVFISSHILSEIDRICTHISVVDEGKSIFLGSMKDMKKRTQSNTLRLELEGNLNLVFENLRNKSGVTTIVKRGEIGLDMSYDSSLSMLEAVRIAIDATAKCGSELISISSSTSSVEDAFLDILKEEESRGFLRAV